ncbi:MAG TPA: MtrAB system histidine kinase MtrB [Amnibacterium sp.]|nr:MtrAB system histidine kinase MtrB [Amnibacterium sp.]
MSSGATAGRPLPGTRLLKARRAAAAPVHLWRRSLRVRTVVVTVLLSTIALIVVGEVLSVSISGGLYRDRVHQVLGFSARAETAAQKTLGTATSFDPTTLGGLQQNAIEQARTAAGAPSGLSWQSSPGQSGSVLPEATIPGGVDAVISPELKQAVESAPTGQHWQPVALPSGPGRTRPGVVVGEPLQVGGNQYELYLVYDLSDVQSTLDFVQRTLLIGGAALLLLIGGVTTVVVSLVVRPIKEAALVSEELAGGRLEQRIPERGEDVVATLARSFNRMADGLQRQITQLANLSRVQQRFVSDVSHELRTPLTTIRLASDVLYDGRDALAPPAARSAELLRDQVERFEALLGDLLEISRMDAQAADVAGEPTNVVELAREAIESLGGLADEMGTPVRLVTPGGHVEIEVDARRIARIVRNLLANAIEHGDGRPIEVTVDSSATAVGLGVRDHGAGMPQHHADRVFDRFWRADPSRQRRIGGTGLGLAISLEDALLHGGSLEVWSREGDGTNFVLTLPRSPDTPMIGRPVPLEPADAFPSTAEAATHRPPTGRLPVVHR